MATVKEQEVKQNGSPVTVRQEAFVKALAWHPTYEQSKSEQVIVIAFANCQERTFVSETTAKLFTDYLEDLQIEYRRFTEDFSDYARKVW